MSGSRFDGLAAPSVGITKFVPEGADSVHHGESSPEKQEWRAGKSIPKPDQGAGWALIGSQGAASASTDHFPP